MSSRQLYLVTGNAHKVQEFERLLPGRALLSLRDHPLPSEPVEDGETFTANSLIKSLAGLEHARSLGLTALSLADDSGLEVDALGGAPGVKSARYAPGSDADRVQALLTALKTEPPEQRSARFHCALSLSGLSPRDEEWLLQDEARAALLASSSDSGLSLHRHRDAQGHELLSLCALGSFEGSIALKPAGAGGFGYDPIFIPRGYERSVAELSADEKDALSHRAVAWRRLQPLLGFLDL